jgi:hypothetical protein
VLEFQIDVVAAHSVARLVSLEAHVICARRA